MQTSDRLQRPLLLVNVKEGRVSFSAFGIILKPVDFSFEAAVALGSRCHENMTSH